MQEMDKVDDSTQVQTRRKETRRCKCGSAQAQALQGLELDREVVAFHLVDCAQVYAFQIHEYGVSRDSVLGGTTRWDLELKCALYASVSSGSTKLPQ